MPNFEILAGMGIVFAVLAFRAAKFLAEILRRVSDNRDLLIGLTRRSDDQSRQLETQAGLISHLGEQNVELLREVQRLRLEDQDEEVKESPPKLLTLRTKPLPGDTNCPYCRGTTRSNGDLAVCALCETRHHVPCYEEYGKCSVYGCESKAVVKGPAQELKQAGVLA